MHVTYPSHTLVLYKLRDYKQGAHFARPLLYPNQLCCTYVDGQTDTKLPLTLATVGSLRLAPIKNAYIQLVYVGLAQARPNDCMPFM